MVKDIFTMIKSKYSPGTMTINNEKADVICDNYIDAATKGIAKN